MTREEAIMWLEGISTREFGWDEFALQESQREIRERCEDCVREAIDMAIEALMHEIRTETHGVCLISKDDAKKAIYLLGKRPQINDVWDCLDALPSANAPKGDLISRHWLLELYGDYIGDNGEPKYQVPLEVVRQNIKDAPSADADRPHGGWIKNDDFICSECGCHMIVGDGAYNYCPNCGARMKGGAE